MSWNSTMGYNRSMCIATIKHVNSRRLIEEKTVIKIINLFRKGPVVLYCFRDFRLPRYKGF